MRYLDTIKFGTLALALTLWAGSAFAQSSGNAGNAGSAQGGHTMTGQSAGSGAGGNAGGNYGGGAGISGGGAGMGTQASTGAGGNAGGANAGGGNAGYLASNFQARVPQYWVADASIFINNAVNTADVLTREQALNVQDPQVFANQAEFLRNSTARAANDLQGLLQNAMQTQPAAVPAIRAALAELAAAEAQTNEFTQAASSGNLGPTYIVTVKSALAHLRAADQSMSRIGNAYGATNFTESASAQR